MKCINRQKHESGRSMVEMVGVLAIMGLLTAGAFVLIKSSLVSQRISRITDEIDVLVANARAMTAQSNDFTQFPASDNFDTDGIALAKSILKSDGVSPFGGQYYLGYKSQAGTNDKCKKVLVVGVKSMSDSADCQMLARRDYADSNFCEAVCNSKSLEIYFTKTN